MKKLFTFFAMLMLFGIGSASAQADTYTLVTNINDLTDGCKVLVHGRYKYSGTEHEQALSTFESNKFIGVDITITDNSITLTEKNTETSPQEITIEKSGNKFLLKTNDGKYITNASYKQNNKNKNNTSLADDGTAIASQWTIDLANDASATITNTYTYTDNVEYTAYFDQSNSSNNINCYLNESSINKVHFYKLVSAPAQTTYNITVNSTNQGFATFYNEKHNVKLPADVKAYTYYINADDELSFANVADGDCEEDGMNIVEAGVAVVLHTTLSENYVLAETTEDAFVSKADKEYKNDLYGCDEETIITADEGFDYYILSYGDAGIAFYNAIDKANDGTTFTCGAHKAYLLTLDLDGAPRFFNLGFGEESTAIDGVQSAEDKTKSAVYNLAGQKVSANFHGIIIKNGKKYFAK